VGHVGEEDRYVHQVFQAGASLARVSSVVNVVVKPVLQYYRIRNRTYACEDVLEVLDAATSLSADVQSEGAVGVLCGALVRVVRSPRRESRDVQESARG
jgi:urease alpha subunit